MPAEENKALATLSEASSKVVEHLMGFTHQIVLNYIAPEPLQLHSNNNNNKMKKVESRKHKRK